MDFHQFTLSNGLQVIAEVNPAVHSVAAGFFVRTGARDETADVSGVSHFLEHMAFKGNDRFTADDMNRIFDEIGANYNASTSEEVTNYYAAVLPEYLDLTLELLTVLVRPSLGQQDFDTEKNVILEEIGMYDDLPAFTAYDTAMSTHFAGHPLGQSVLGTNDSIAALTSAQMRQYHAEHYRAGNMILAVAGQVDFKTLSDLIEKHCSGLPAGQTVRSEPRPDIRTAVRLMTRPSSVQQHVIQMASAPDNRSRLRHAAELLAVIVGDDSGSRLYWELVDPGHVESADLGYNEYDGAGAWMSYLSCLPENVERNLERMRIVFEDVNRHGVTAEELEQARNKVASRIVLRGERPMGRLSSLGGNWLARSEYSSVEDDLRLVRSLTQHDIRELLEQYPLRMNTTAGVGPLHELSVEPVEHV